MKSAAIIFIIVIIIVIVVFLVFKGGQPKEAFIINLKNKIMKIESTVFKNNQQIPSKYTCDGENTNPPLEFSDVPEKAKSLVLIMDDPDAPRGTFVHWVVFNIDPQTKDVAEGKVPDNGAEGVTSFGKQGYGGPCPPSGTHRYFFKLYALDEKLNLNRSAGKKEVESAMVGHILAQAELIGLYQRK